MLAYGCRCADFYRNVHGQDSWVRRRGLLPRLPSRLDDDGHVQLGAVRVLALQRQPPWQLLAAPLPTFYTLISAILTNVQPMWILVIGSWKLCCAPCATFGIKEADCTTPTGKTFPPNTPNVMRPCDIDGNVFWDASYCGGTKLSTFPSKASGWAVQILCTWGGFIFMFIGILQATQLHRKMGKQWRAIRAGRR